MYKNSSTWKEIPGEITTPKGYVASAIHAGIKPGSTRKDLALLYSLNPARGAGLFTTNRVVAAPVRVCRQHLAESRGRIQAVVVNSGNANACTGRPGFIAAQQTAKEVAKVLGVSRSSVLVASTGVIGQPLPLERIQIAIRPLKGLLCFEGGRDFSEAILTTDTRPKVCVLQSRLGRESLTLAGVAKGAGMIHPRMATMLAFLTTDAAISTPLLRAALKTAVDESFNRLTVDGDTSTNDSVLLFANGAAGVEEISKRGKPFEHFQDGLAQVCTSLAQMIARDGEGASKFITITVAGARTASQAEMVARAISNSPLVKTAIAGADANWGRIICAAGYSGASIDPDRIDIGLCGVQVCRRGQQIAFDELRTKQLLSGPEIRIDLNLNQGTQQARMWTCDLTEGYIRINAAYRT
ncbi:MAG: bifunctional glutamate N-acetyltransferase/amino-acid acetyltransferase ArgJ [Acidobacteriia bacterium]|nr:bifunctional glutamate N-acetyltransferase/amino-acid acetyltransferase ArgJ [Terriglobia bacterium]